MSHSCCANGASILAPQDDTAQERFNKLYVTSTQIAERLGVTRQAVLAARQRGLLPDSIDVGGAARIYIWEAAPVEPYLAAWEQSVKLRRGETITIPLGAK